MTTPHPSRRQVLGAIGAAVAASTIGTAGAQQRNDTMTIIVPFGPGGATDIVARMVATQLQTRLGHPVIVDYKPGANGVVALAYLKRQAPDGKTLMIVPGVYSSAPATNPKINNYNPATDYTPIARMVNTAAALAASSKFAPKTLDDILAYAKANPGKVKVGTTGIGANDHLIPFRMARRIGTEFNFIHYKGSAPAIQDLMSGEIDIKIDSVASLKAALDSGRVRHVAMVNAGGTSITPQSKSIAETLPGIGIASYFGMIGPAGMAPQMVEQLRREIISIVKMEELQPRFRQLAIDVAPMGPAEFSAYMTNHYKETVEVVKEAGIKLE